VIEVLGDRPTLKINKVFRYLRKNKVWNINKQKQEGENTNIFSPFFFSKVVTYGIVK